MDSGRKAYPLNQIHDPIALMELFGHPVGEGHPCFLIGEIGLNYNGDPKIARQLIRIESEVVGCNAVKREAGYGIGTGHAE